MAEYPTVASVPTWTQDDLTWALKHGLQQQALQRTIQRLRDLRSASTWAEMHDLQAALLTDLLWAQEYKSRANRNVARIKARRLPLEQPESGSWELEKRIAARVERQIRMVGDALAWKLFSCRRHVFWTLSQNASPGAMHGKSGLAAELNRVDQHWSQGHFALINDLTQSVRIADLIVFTPDGPKLDEVKTNPTRERSAQRRRVRSALAVLNKKKPIEVDGESHELFEATTQMKTRLRDLGHALEVARDGGLGTRVIRQGWAVAAIRTIARVPAGPDAQTVWLTAQSDLKNRAGLLATEHLLQSMWTWQAWDLPEVGVRGVPFGAYPFDAQTCAELTCGFSTFQTYLSTDLIDSALQRAGFDTEWHLPRANDWPSPRAVVVTVSRPAPDGRRGISVQASAFNQILFELVEPNRYAAALREAFDWSLTRFPRQTAMPGELRRILGHATIAFANERAVWFRKA